MSDTPTLTLSGDADIIFVTVTGLFDELSALPENAAGDGLLARLCQRLQSELPDWTVTQQPDVRELRAGQCVREYKKTLPELLIGFQLHGEECRRVEQQLADDLHTAGVPESARVEIDAERGITAWLFVDGTLSLSVWLRIAEGWSQHTEQLMAVFGPEGREANLACDIVSRAMVCAGGCQAKNADDSACGPFRRLEQALRVHVSKLYKVQLKQREQEFPYYHVIYGGACELDEPGQAALATPYRDLLYVHGPESVRSQSPYLDEFVFLGNAFSLIAYTNTSRHGLAVLPMIVQVCEFHYSRLDDLCRALEARLTASSKVKLNRLLDLQERIQTSYTKLSTPTFSFNHRVRELRDAILHEFGLATLLQRAECFLEVVRGRERRRRDRMTRIIEWGLAFIALLTIIEAADAVLSLCERFSLFK